MVRVNGEPSTVVGYTNNGKLLVEGKWGKFGGTHAVSPADIDDNPGMITSAASGFANSLLKTGTGAAHIFGAHPQGLENAQSNAQTAQQANPASGKAGELAGDLVQFLAANGVVKASTGAVAALEVPEQYKAAAMITKALADHPALAKILHAGINGAITGGGLAGVQSGGSAKAAAEGAAGGALGEIGGEVLPGVVKAGAEKAGELAQTVRDLPSKVEPPGIIRKLWPEKIETPSATEEAQSKIQSRINTQPAYDQHASDIRKAFVNGLKDHGVDFQVSPDVDVRKIPDLAKKALENEYKPLYGKVDEALEKEGFEDKYQTLEDNLDQAREAAKQARKLADTTPEGVITANKGVTEAKAQLDEANAILKEQNLDGAVKRASSLYKASKAADEFKTKILSHTQDFNGTLPRTDPNGFNKALNNLKYKQRYGSNRLDQLFGEKAGGQLMEDTRAAQTRVSGLNDAEKLRVAGVQDLKDKAAQVLKTRRRTRNVALATGAIATPIGREIIRHTVE